MQCRDHNSAQYQSIQTIRIIVHWPDIESSEVYYTKDVVSSNDHAKVSYKQILETSHNKLLDY